MGARRGTPQGQRTAMVLFCSLLLACSDDEPPNVGSPPPQSCPAPGPIPPLPLVCLGDCHDYVISDLQIPFTSQDVQKFSLVHNGKKYNAMGYVFGLIAEYMPEVKKLQTCTAGLIYQGTNVTLLRVQLPEVSGQTRARGQLWVGQDQSCCPKATSFSQCQQDGLSTCFSGKAQLRPEAAADRGMILDGTEDTGKLDIQGRRAELRISRDCKNLVRIPLSTVQIRGTVTKDGITGVLAGTISKKDMDTIVIPMLATSLNMGYVDPATGKSTRDIIKWLFDTNKDGTITTAEFAKTPLVKTFLGGDMCESRMSIGMGFTAVKAKIMD